jgi:hypothetical protein
MVVPACIPSFSQGGGRRISWVQGQPGLHGKTVSQNQINKFLNKVKTKQNSSDHFIYYSPKSDKME